jgi:hypothetical protein
MLTNCQAKRRWQRKLEGVATILLGSLFEYEEVLILGTASGNIRIWKEEKVIQLTLVSDDKGN